MKKRERLTDKGRKSAENKSRPGVGTNSQDKALRGDGTSSQDKALRGAGRSREDGRISGSAGENETPEGGNSTETAMDFPSSALLERELKKENYRKRFYGTMRSTVFGLITVAAVAVLVAVLFLPVLHIYGQSMNGTLDNGDIVLSVKSSRMETGEIIAFYYNNNILVKRVIAGSGEWVNLDAEGNVYVNQKLIDEPYLREPKAYGETDIELPCQVPEGKVFVMGDNREVSIDSRNTAVGCVDREQIVGHIAFRVWPLRKLGFIK